MKRPVVLGLVMLAVLAAMPTAPAAAGFPGRNGRLVFQRSDLVAGGQGDIYTITAVGTGGRNLTVTHVLHDGDPAWSSSGKRIAFRRHGAGPDQLWVMDGKGNGLAVVPGSGPASGPSWSPGGDMLVYECRTQRPTETDICVRNVDGTGFAQLTATSGLDERGPVWSPDGTRIVFSRALVADSGSFLVSLDLASGSSTDLTPQVVGTYDWRPDWSPNNREIVFTRFVTGSGTGAGEAIYRMDASGGAPLLVTAPPTGSDTHHTMPAWSPDGKKIAYCHVADDGQWGHIFTINPDGTGNTQITFGPETDMLPDWQAV